VRKLRSFATLNTHHAPTHVHRRVAQIGRSALCMVMAVSSLVGVTTGVLVATGSSAGAATPAWTTSEDTLPTSISDRGVFNDVSCTSPGNCTAVGGDTSNQCEESDAISGESPGATCNEVADFFDSRAFYAVESGGTWGPDIPVADPSASASWSSFNSVSCTSASDCTAVGVDGNLYPIYAVESGGVWSDATDITAGDYAAGSEGFSSVSCTTAINCTAVGNSGVGIETFPIYSVESGLNEWSPPAVLPISESSGYASGVSCTSPADCTAVGLEVANNSSISQPFNAVESGDGQFEQATVVAASGVAYYSSVSCTSSGNCTAVGDDDQPNGDSSGDFGDYWLATPIYAVESGSNWGAVTDLTTPAGTGFISGISCSSATICTAVGTDNSDANPIYTVESYAPESGISWSTPADATGVGDSNFAAVSCAANTAATLCSAVGNDTNPQPIYATSLATPTISLMPANSLSSNPSETYDVTVSDYGSDPYPTGVVTVSDQNASSCQISLNQSNDGTGDCSLGESVSGQPFTVVAYYNPQGDPNYSTAETYVVVNGAVGGGQGGVTPPLGSGNVSVTATGGKTSDVITYTSYPTDPLPAHALPGGSDFFDVTVSNPAASNFTKVVLSVCDLGITPVELEWFNNDYPNDPPAKEYWNELQLPPPQPVDGCETYTAGKTSPPLPDIADLTGTVFALVPFGITTNSLPEGSVYSTSNKAKYSATLSAYGGNVPYKWSLASGSGPLPPGLKLSPKGVISGKASAIGNYPFTVQLADKKTKTKPPTQNVATQNLSITIAAPTIAIAAGGDHSCAIATGGTVYCWGDNSNGQLGDGSTTNSSTPVEVSGLSKAFAISAGHDSTCALAIYGTVWCWGYNGDGDLGNGTTTDSSVPVNIAGLSGATAIASGGDHSCALFTGGTVDCWGLNANGELGIGNNTGPDSCGGSACSTAPVAVPGLSGVTAIAAGNQHSCALLAGGTVDCWGWNDDGQLGNGTTTDSASPVAVTGLSGATAITTGYEHTCATLTENNNTVDCWGYNADGELGNGTTTNSSTPVAVSLGKPFAISAGLYHTCALALYGTIFCWGYNGDGELGNGTTSSSSTPVEVGSISGVTAIAAGGYHTCALLTGGSAVDCWGYNGYGELGNGTTTSSSAPVAVSELP
jgi:alpha-tubulin suppressor-like RCC1 family protein